MKFTPFNINNYVKVRVTDHGQKCLRQEYDELVKFCHGKFPYSFEETLKKEDDDGYQKWQLHDLMRTFGKHISMGLEIPIELEILISNEDI